MMPGADGERPEGSADFSRQLGSTLDAVAVYGVGIVIAFAPFAGRLLALISGQEFAAGAPALVVISFAIALAGLTHVLRFTLVAWAGRAVLIADAWRARAHSQPTSRSYPGISLPGCCRRDGRRGDRARSSR